MRLRLGLMISAVGLVAIIGWPQVVRSLTMAERTAGYILLQVEKNGEAWYVYPKTLTRFFLSRPANAFGIMRQLGLGITNTNLAKIPKAGSSIQGDLALRQKLSGYILLQVEKNGEAWYVYPKNKQRYYLGRPSDAFSIMRRLGLGVTNTDLGQIKVDPTMNCPDNIKYDPITNSPIWIKGDVTRPMSGEEDQWIRLNCPGWSGDPRDGVTCPPNEYPNPDYLTAKSFVIDPKDSQTMYIGVEIKGVFKSTDGGASWRPSSKGILAYPIRPLLINKCHVIAARIIIDPTNSQRLLMSHLEDAGPITAPFSETGGLWESTDAAQNWHQLLRGQMNGSGNPALAVDSQHTATIYFGSNNWYTENDLSDQHRLWDTKGILFKTVDNGNNWAELPTGVLPWLSATGIFVDPKNSAHLILFGAVKSRDTSYSGEMNFYPLESLNAGLSWQSWRNRIPSPCTGVTEGAVAQDFNHLYLNGTGCGNLVSADGGQTFQEISQGAYLAIFDPHDPTGNHMVGYQPYGSGSVRTMLESFDAGVTWVSLGAAPAEVDNLKIKISNIVWDPSDQQTIFMNGSQGHLWRSRDGGKTWQTILTLDRLPG